MFAFTSSLWRVVQPDVAVIDGDAPPPRLFAKGLDNKSAFGTSSRFYDHDGTCKQVSMMLCVFQFSIYSTIS